MKLYAISDLHLSNPANRQALDELPAYPNDWLILGGDICESTEQLDDALALLSRRFARLLWVPGNHELWTLPQTVASARGERKYQALVDVCHRYDVITPEDSYPIWPGEGPRCVIAPLFLLYDYSFRPDHVPAQQVLAWAEEAGIMCADEIFLHPDPYPTRQAWCAARCAYSEARLSQIPEELPVIMVNHYPLRQDLVRIPRIPRFSPWCGTRHTENWHRRFRVLAAISGHLHVRGTQWRDGVRFEEVSLGYPRDWDAHCGIAAYLRQILPQ